MVIKPYVVREARDPRLKAGIVAEEKMAHYLDRQFRKSERFHVLHSLELQHEGDPAQIDHLVVHPFGVAIVESKSVSETVRVTQAGEWERQFHGRWQGIPDPTLQADRQGMVLKRLLQSRESELLDKVLLGMLQGTFSFMAVDVFAAISVEGRIERARPEQAMNVLKADRVPGAIEAVVAGYRKDTAFLNPNLVALAKAPRDFNKAERLRIARFLEAADRGGRSEVVYGGGVAKGWRPGSAAGAVGHPSAGTAPLATAESAEVEPQLFCKSCGSADLELRSGFGAYGRCRACGTNSGVKKRCSCGGSMKSSIAGQGIENVCGQCGMVQRVRVGAGSD